VYWGYWWSDIDPSRRFRDGHLPDLKADWVDLIWPEFKSELQLLQKHLAKNGKVAKRQPCNLGTNVTKVLLHFGYTLAELLNSEMVHH
jgi:hypothetical protein